MPENKVRHADIDTQKITRGPMSGAYRLSALVNGRFVSKAYLYYTKREAQRLFHAYVNSL